MNLSRKDLFFLSLQRSLCYLCWPIVLIISLCFFTLMFYRIRNPHQTRQRFMQLMQENQGRPVIIALNHLTRIDSMILPLAFMPLWKFFFNYTYLPWHLLEKRLISFPPVRVIAYLAKTIPVTRMGNRKEVHAVEKRIEYLLTRGELVVIFPEGTRSSTGRVNTTEFQYGVGDIVKDLPGCRVLCTYVRSNKQTTKGHAPPWNSTIDIQFEMLEPTTTFTGPRASRDIASQVIHRIAKMEEDYFAQPAHNRK